MKLHKYYLLFLTLLFVPVQSLAQEVLRSYAVNLACSSPTLNPAQRLECVKISLDIIREQFKENDESVPAFIQRLVVSNSLLDDDVSCPLLNQDWQVYKKYEDTYSVAVLEVTRWIEFTFDHVIEKDFVAENVSRAFDISKYVFSDIERLQADFDQAHSQCGAIQKKCTTLNRIFVQDAIRFSGSISDMIYDLAKFYYCVTANQEYVLQVNDMESPAVKCTALSLGDLEQDLLPFYLDNAAVAYPDNGDGGSETVADPFPVYHKNVSIPFPNGKRGREPLAEPFPNS